MGAGLSHTEEFGYPSLSPSLSQLQHLPCRHPPAQRTQHNPCPSRSSPPAARETFCYLQDGAKSPLRLKIPCDWTRFGGHPRHRERNPSQALPGAASLHRHLPGAAGEGSTAPSPQPGRLAPSEPEMLWEPLGRASPSLPGQSPSPSPAQGPRGPERWAMRLNSLFPMSAVEAEEN